MLTGNNICTGANHNLVTPLCEGLHVCNQFLDTAQVTNRGALEGDHLEEVKAVANLPMPIKCQRPLGPLRTGGIQTNHTEAAQSPLQVFSYQQKMSQW